MDIEFFVYILYSPTINTYYIGQTTNLKERLEQHNNHVFKGAFTRRATDWEIYHSICCDTKKQAILIEGHLKSAKKRKYLEDLKKYPKIGFGLLLKYSEDKNQ